MGQNQGKTGGQKNATLGRRKNSERNYIENSGKLKVIKMEMDVRQ